MISNIDKYVHLFYTSRMKLSQDAKQQGSSYRTALRWFREGAIKGYQAPSGTIITQAERMSITVVRLPLDTPGNRAMASYNAFHEEMRMASAVMTTSGRANRVILPISRGSR